MGIPVTFVAFYTYDEKVFLSVKVRNETDGRDTIDFEVTTNKNYLSSEDIDAVLTYVQKIYNKEPIEEINADIEKISAENIDDRKIGSEFDLLEPIEKIIEN